MLSIAGLYLAVTALLALGGVLKVLRPNETATALAALGLPSQSFVIRGLGLVEIVIGIVAFGTGHPIASLLTAGAYMSFAGFVLIARRAKTPVQSCGCFGKAETPPSIIHITVNLMAAGVAVLIAIWPIPALTELLSDQPGAGVPLLLLTAVIIYLLYVALTALPQTLRAVRTS